MVTLTLQLQTTDTTYIQYWVEKESVLHLMLDEATAEEIAISLKENLNKNTKEE